MKHLVFAFIFNCMLFSAFAQEMSEAEAQKAFDTIYSDVEWSDREIINRASVLLPYFMEKEDSCKVAKLARMRATPYENSGAIDSALYTLLLAEPYSKACSWKSFGRTITGLASTYLTLQEFEKVEELIIGLETNYKGLVPDSIINISKGNLAIAYAYMDRIPESKRVFKEIQEFNHLAKDTLDEIDALNNLGALYGMLGDLDSAAYFLEQASVLCAEIECSNQLELLQNLATLASELDDPVLSEMYLDSALNIAIKNGNIASRTSLYREIALTYSDQGKMNLAVNYLIKHSDWKDSLFHQQRAQATAEFEELYQNEKQARQIQELEFEKLDSEVREGKLRRSKNLYLGIGIGVVLLAIGLWTRLSYISRTKAIIKEERNRSDSLLLNILPVEVANELKAKGKAEARDFDMVSIIFTDFAEFTSTAEKMTAAELVNEVDYCFRAFDAIIEKYQIEKIKTIGDAYMAAGGLHTPRTSEPKDVVMAALEMQLFIQERKTQNTVESKSAFEMRIGIHTGPVVAGIVGVKKFQYDIWGDTVNTASRMESNSEVGRVNISQATYELLKDDPNFTFEKRGKIEVKGKGEMEMYFIKTA